jgi:hypothetical protein
MEHLGRLSRQRAMSQALTDAQREKLEETDDACVHCGGYHARSCPRVRRMEFAPNGTMIAIEFWRADEIDWEGVLWTDVGGDALIVTRDVVADLTELISWSESKTHRMSLEMQERVRRLILWRDEAVQSGDDQEQA